MFIIPKQIVQSMGAYLIIDLIIGVIVYPIVLLGGLALLDKQLSKKISAIVNYRFLIK